MTYADIISRLCHWELDTRRLNRDGFFGTGTILRIFEDRGEIARA